MRYKTRKYTPEDCGTLADLFYNTVHSVNAEDYTEEQLAVWATGRVDLNQWNESFLAHYTLVAVLHEEIAGFGDIDESGYLDRLYVHKDHQEGNRDAALRATGGACLPQRGYHACIDYSKALFY